MPGLLNLVLNGAIAWLIMRHNEVLTLWDEGPVGPDLLITGFLLAFLSCLIVSRVIRGQIEKGDLPRLDPLHVDANGLHRRPPLVRSLVLGVIGLVAGAVPAIALLDWLGAAPMTLGGFVAFKAVWAGLLAAAISPFIAWWALLAASDETRVPALAPAS